MKRGRAGAGRGQIQTNPGASDRGRLLALLERALRPADPRPRAQRGRLLAGAHPEPPGPKASSAPRASASNRPWAVTGAAGANVLQRYTAAEADVAALFTAGGFCY